MSQETELKACPFCGGSADLWYRGTRYGYIVMCECSVCGAKSRAFGLNDLDEYWTETLAARRATEAWNRWC